jgi:hypothetical protein
MVLSLRHLLIIIVVHAVIVSFFSSSLFLHPLGGRFKQIEQWLRARRTTDQHLANEVANNSNHSAIPSATQSTILVIFTILLKKKNDKANMRTPHQIQQTPRPFIH